MNRANFMSHLAPCAMQATDLQPMQQAAMEIKFRRQNERKRDDKAALSNVVHAGNPMVGMASLADRNWQRDYVITESAEKPHHRGGMTFRPWDALANPPRRTMDDL